MIIGDDEGVIIYIQYHSFNMLYFGRGGFELDVDMRCILCGFIMILDFSVCIGLYSVLTHGTCIHLHLSSGKIFWKVTFLRSCSSYSETFKLTL